MRLCQKCVMPVQEGENLCKGCRNHKPKAMDWSAKEKEFFEIAEAYRGKGKEYDFLVYYTGSRDGTSALYYLVRVLKARVLAYTWDNYLIRDEALENVRNVTNTLGIEHIKIAYNPEVIKAIFRGIMRNDHSPCICGVFHGLAGIDIALQREIPVILFPMPIGLRGGSHSFRIDAQDRHFEKMKKFLETWQRVFRFMLKEYEPAYFDKLQTALFERFEPYFIRKREDVFYPVNIPLSNFVNWLTWKDLPSMLQDLKWKQPGKTVFHGTCHYEPARGYNEYAGGTPGPIANEMSYLIREGFISRNDAITYLETASIGGERPVPAVERFCRTMQLDRAEYESILKRPLPIQDREDAERNQAAMETYRWLVGMK